MTFYPYLAIGAGAIALLAVIILVAVHQKKASWNPAFPTIDRTKRQLVCVGDSITFGAGVFPKQEKRSYPAYLQALLGDSVQVVNAGLSGRTLLKEGDVPYTKEKHYSKTFIPSARYIVMLGTNDAKGKNWNEEAFRLQYFSFLHTYVCRVGAENVIVMKPPKAFIVPPKKVVNFEILDENVQKVCSIVDEIAAELGIQVIDLYSFTQDHIEWFPDGIHPNKQGNKAIANHIFEQLK